MTDTAHHATLEPDDHGWLARLVEIPQIHAWARTQGEAKEYLLHALAHWLDVPVGDVGTVVFSQAGWRRLAEPEMLASAPGD
ncbi:MAG: hypothetical protein ACHQNA_05995 [Acidimicrobiales bacterium]